MPESRPRGRTIVVFGLAGLLACFVVLTASVGYERAWQIVGVDVTMMPPFADALNVTSAWECTRQGFDVQQDNPCDPWGRPMNYPSIWLFPALLGLGVAATPALGGLGVCLWLGASVALSWRMGRLGGVALLAAAVSPPVLLAVERGNSDLVILGLLVVSGALAGRPGALGTAGLLVTLLATLAKLFPVFALVASLRRPALMRTLVLSLLVLGVYALTSWEELEVIFAVVPRRVDMSYGAVVSVGALARVLGWQGVPVLGAHLAVVLGGSLLALPLSTRLGPESIRPGHAGWWILALAVYAGTFALGGNWDYRLVFLLLAIPGLRDLAEGGQRLAAGTTLALILGLLWTSGSRPWDFILIDDLFATALFVVALAWVLAGLRLRWRSHPL